MGAISKEQTKDLIWLLVVAFIAFGFLLWVWKYTPMYQLHWERQRESAIVFLTSPANSNVSQEDYRQQLIKKYRIEPDEIDPSRLDTETILLSFVTPQLYRQHPLNLWEHIEKFMFQAVAGVKWEQK